MIRYLLKPENINGRIFYPGSIYYKTSQEEYVILEVDRYLLNYSSTKDSDDWKLGVTACSFTNNQWEENIYLQESKIMSDLLCADITARVNILQELYPQEYQTVINSFLDKWNDLNNTVDTEKESLGELLRDSIFNELYDKCRGSYVDIDKNIDTQSFIVDLIHHSDLERHITLSKLAFKEIHL